MDIAQFKGKNVTVVGLASSGLAAARLLKESEAVVKITDNGDSAELAKRASELEGMGVACEIGRHTEAFLEGTELFVVSPGVEDGSLPIKWAQERGIRIISEIELGYIFCKGRIIAISGTNGKSTVTSLIGEIFKKAGMPVYVCGNIGLPFTEIALKTKEGDVVVLEISSFQLERIDTFRPHIAILLNITEDHLDRYNEFSDYVDAKMRMFANQGEDDHAILNYDQTRLRNIAPTIRSKVLFFSKNRLSTGHDGAYVENEELVVRKDKRYVWLASSDSLSLKGEHNLENSLASGLAALLMGAEPDCISGVLTSFKTLGHRFEFIGTVKGVRFIDDSKATNVDSVYKALQSSPRGIILIAGGKDKGGDYRILTNALREKVKSLVLIGEAREKIAKVFSDVVPVNFASDMNDAVAKAFDKSKSGDTVMLSPMCSSFDMFKDYKERGDLFCKAVEALNTIRGGSPSLEAGGSTK
ncbi:MAG: UDP-N-acetylmuramoyl-L-alanine--D-glutamate ligase [Candidatus Omnitrophota bacterium]